MKVKYYLTVIDLGVLEQFGVLAVSMLQQQEELIKNVEKKKLTCEIFTHIV
jgi:hypothetical protein